MMKKVLFFIAVLMFSSSSICNAAPRGNYVKGDFEIWGSLSTGMGWQRFMGGTPTEAASDGSYAGVLGSVLTNIATGTMPTKDENPVEAFVEVLNLNMGKKFGDRARFRGDLFLGRAFSNSWSLPAPGISIYDAYVTVKLFSSPFIELTFGKFETLLGVEPFEPYAQDTVSWSIHSRTNIYPYSVTGVQLSFGLADDITLYVAAANTLTFDTNLKGWNTPSGFATLEVKWGDEGWKDSFLLTPYGGPESAGTRPLTYGINATVLAWLSKTLHLSAEGTFRRDNSAGGSNTDYEGGGGHLRWDVAKDWYGVVKYAYLYQSANGNGVYNLTGTAQQIHEMSLGGGYIITDWMKLKFEARLDAIVPNLSKRQWVPGVAMALVSSL